MAKQNSDEIYLDMPPSQKTALLCIALGQRWSTAILRLLKPSEIRQVSYWINQLDYVPQELTERVIRDFYERLVKKTSLGGTGGGDYLMDVLSNLMGKSKAVDLIDELTNTEQTEVFRILRKVEPRHLAAYLKNEQPQTVALMMSYLDPSRAAMIIAEFPPEVQIDVVWRLARLEEADPDVIAAMERSLNQHLGAMAMGKKAKKVGGTKSVAEIMNNLGHDGEKIILEALQEKDFDLATEIKDLMFVFADIVLLDDKSIQTLIKDVDQADLVVALKGSPDPVKEKIFKNISKRQVDTITDELSFMGPLKASVVREAQQKIVNLVRKLDEEGKILIQGKGGGDEVIT